MGVMDENGAITIQGRSADAARLKVLADGSRFKACTEVVHPGPIEDVLTDMPVIADAQVC